MTEQEQEINNLNTQLVKVQNANEALSDRVREFTLLANKLVDWDKQYPRKTVLSHCGFLESELKHDSIIKYAKELLSQPTKEQEK